MTETGTDHRSSAEEEMNSAREAKHAEAVPLKWVPAWWAEVYEAEKKGKC